jgi:predicted Fe-Mo cluster-binding NifX family protein
MKIAITATGPDPDSSVDPRFGRCAYFLIIDPKTMEYGSIENPNILLGGGAGIQVIAGVSGSVQEAVNQFNSGAYLNATIPNVTDHFGMGRGSRGMSRSPQEAIVMRTA